MERGEVGVLSTNTCPFCVTWQIDDFFSLPEEANAIYWSPDFNFLDESWCLIMYPNGQSTFDGEGWIGFFLRRNDQGHPKSIRYTLAIRKADGTEIDLFSVKSNIFSEAHASWGIDRFLHRSELMSQKSKLAPLNALTIVCTLWEDEPRPANGLKIISRGTQTEDLTGSDGAKEEDGAFLDTKGGNILRKHFQNLLISGKDHDVILKVKEHQFRAHKNILRARSPVFAAMFAHNMIENESGDVCIDDCDPRAFGEFLKYVYAGKLGNIYPATAVGLYYIADKYGFPDLKETCVKYLKASLTVNVLCDVITLAMIHVEDELLEFAMEFFSKHLVETLMTVEWHHFLMDNPILANELNIKALIKKKAQDI